MTRRSVTAACIALAGLAACARRGYGITYPKELLAEHSESALDAGADCLVERIEAQGLLLHGIAASYLREAEIQIVTFPEAQDDGPGMAVSGRTDGHTIYLLWQPGADIARGSLQHELVHAILCRVNNGPCDAGHDASAWWRPIVPGAQDCWAEALAPPVAR
jgi:hypothetical protein